MVLKPVSKEQPQDDFASTVTGASIRLESLFWNKPHLKVTEHSLFVMHLARSYTFYLVIFSEQSFKVDIIPIMHMRKLKLRYAETHNWITEIGSGRGGDERSGPKTSFNGVYTPLLTTALRDCSLP